MSAVPTSPIRLSLTYRILIVIGVVLVTLQLVGCGTAASDPVTSGPQIAAAQGFPRSISVPASEIAKATTLEMTRPPQRIAALTYESAELVAALGAGDRLVMVPAAVTNPVLTNHQALMSGVESKAATESSTNAEAVIETTPDLVILSARHGLHDGAGKVLAAAGIPVLVLPNSWATTEDLIANINLTGQVLGSEEEADKLAMSLAQGLAEEQASSCQVPPRVLVLSNQAGQPFVTTGQAFPLEIVRLAGGIDAAADLGMTSSGPITAEQMIQAAPDAVVLIDMNGSGEKLFSPLLSNPAVSKLAAMTHDKMIMVEGREIQALGMESVIAGRTELATWMCP